MTQEDVELAYQEAMMNMARLNRTGTVVGGCLLQGRQAFEMGPRWEMFQVLLAMHSLLLLIQHY